MKYELNQLVWYLKDNKIHSAKILSRMLVENALSEGTSDIELFEKNYAFGCNCLEYSTVHGKFKEDQLFPSKEELIESL